MADMSAGISESDFYDAVLEKLLVEEDRLQGLPYNCVSVMPSYNLYAETQYDDLIAKELISFASRLQNAWLPLTMFECAWLRKEGDIDAVVDWADHIRHALGYIDETRYPIPLENIDIDELISKSRAKTYDCITPRRFSVIYNLYDVRNGNIGITKYMENDENNGLTKSASRT